jgi:hypothetical protein
VQNARAIGRLVHFAFGPAAWAGVNALNHHVYETFSPGWAGTFVA